MGVKGKYFTLYKLMNEDTDVIHNMEEIEKKALLFDFYGELLTEHQRGIYSDIVMNDLSYSEVARDEGTSRQSVYDLVKRCDRILEEYEEKLQLVEKFLETKSRVSHIHKIATELISMNKEQELVSRLEEIKQISSDIYESY